MATKDKKREPRTGESKKIIDLPITVIEVLTYKAIKERTNFKNYAEKVLIKHAGK